MPIQSYQLHEFQGAAVQMCLDLQEGPYDDMAGPDGYGRQRWQIYAERMFETLVMLRAMQSHGIMP